MFIETEKVQIVNINNVNHLETYLFDSKDRCREVAINSPAARKAQINIENAKSFSLKIVFPNETTNKLE